MRQREKPVIPEGANAPESVSAEQVFTDVTFEQMLRVEGAKPPSPVNGPLRHVLALCERYGVALVQSTEEEISGEWNWLAEDRVSDTSFRTKAACARDAVHVLGLQ